MNLRLLLDAPLAVQLHLATVVPAFALGTWLLFFSRKGSPQHRLAGAVYLLLMTVTAICACFVRVIRPGEFSLIHLLVPLTLYGVFAALWNVRRGNIAGHRRAMLGLYAGALLIAGGFAFMPGRLLHRLLFG